MRRPRGFTLIDTMVALGVTLLLAAALAALNRSQLRIARRQTQAADLEQSARLLGAELARVARMAGRGGLRGPGACEALNDTVPGSRIGGPGTPQVLAGSDVLIVRGVFQSPVAMVAAVAERAPGVFDLELRPTSPLGEEQELEAFVELLDGGAGEALLLSADPAAGVAVVELLGGSAGPSAGEPGAAVSLTVASGGSELAEGYLRLVESTGSRLDPSRAQRVGVLEEYRYYSRVSPDPYAAADRVRMARARFYPGSEVAHPSSPAAGEDLVDHALDLQVALGFDLDGDGRVDEGADPTERAADEWLGNDPGDDRHARDWAASGPLLIRVSGFLRSARPQIGYLAPARERLEDRLYQESEVPTATELAERRHLRARFQRVVRRRNP